MKGLLTICILALCSVNAIVAQDALCYKLSNASECSVGQSYTSNSVIALDSSVIINGMTISGRLTLQNRHSLARVSNHSIDDILRIRCTDGSELG